MEQSTINQRLKFLVDSVSPSARAFSELIGESPTTTHNYTSKRNAEPRAGYLGKLLSHFSNVNARWLMTGDGEPFVGNSPAALTQTNISGDGNNVASGKNGRAIQKNYSVADCEKERDTYKVQLDKALTENQSLRDQLVRADQLVAAKDEMLDLLRGGFNRPN